MLDKVAVPSADIETQIIDVLRHRVGKDERAAKPHDWFTAAALTLRDAVIDRWMESTRKTYDEGGKRVYYLSLEFLIGRLMRDTLSNMGMTAAMEQALKDHGLELSALEDLEPDAALGNGGLGRLAACFMESLASLDIPAYGYGIRYVNGMFRQRIKDGWQVEFPETWLAHGNPWEFERRESAYRIGFGGEVVADGDSVAWHPAEEVEATAVDTPIAGWRGKRVNTLRLWTATPLDPLRLDAFNAGDHAGALADQNRADALVRVLYPADSSAAGQELRLRQEYFFTSASIQDIVRRHVQYHHDARTLPDKAAIQLNDTHPSVAGGRADAAAGRRPRAGIRRSLGDHPEDGQPTPTTPCCPKRWRAGRSRCSSGCCRATCRSSTRSTAACCAMRARRGSTMLRCRQSR